MMREKTDSTTQVRPEEKSRELESVARDLEVIILRGVTPDIFTCSGKQGAGNRC